MAAVPPYRQGTYSERNTGAACWSCAGLNTHAAGDRCIYPDTHPQETKGMKRRYRFTTTADVVVEVDDSQAPPFGDDVDEAERDDLREEWAYDEAVRLAKDVTNQAAHGPAAIHLDIDGIEAEVEDV